MTFEEEYKSRVDSGGYNPVNHAIILYDVIWVLAVALSNTVSMINDGTAINETGCQNFPGSLVPLEQFTYANERMGCLIQWNLQKTNFSGLTVSS